MRLGWAGPFLLRGSVTNGPPPRRAASSIRMDWIAYVQAIYSAAQINDDDYHSQLLKIN